MAEKHILDEVGPVEFFGELVALHGVQRAAQLVGHAVVWGAADLQSKADILRFMQDRGMSQKTAYRVLEDFAELLVLLEDRHGWCGTLPQVAFEVRKIVACQI